MKRILSTLSLVLVSSHSYAIVNGTPLDWHLKDNIVRLDSKTLNLKGQCTGTLLAGKYILTAAHCLEKRGDIDSVATHDDKTVASNYSTFQQHPDYVYDSDNTSIDVGIIALPQPIEYQAAQFIANPSTYTLEKGEAISVSGFGGTSFSEQPLNRADFAFDKPHWSLAFHIYVDNVNEASDSYTTGGDSGAAWANDQGDIVAIHKGSNASSTGSGNNLVWIRETYGIDLAYAKDFILETVNGWHYPTLVDTDETGKATLTIQSLHKDNVDDNGFYADGDASIVNNTCTNVASYEKCTITIQSNGEEGQVYLSTDDVININKPQSDDTPSEDDKKEPNSNDGENGGSLHLWVLALLSVFGVARRARTQ